MTSSCVTVLQQSVAESDVIPCILSKRWDCSGINRQSQAVYCACQVISLPELRLCWVARHPDFVWTVQFFSLVSGREKPVLTFESLSGFCGAFLLHCLHFCFPHNVCCWKCNLVFHGFIMCHSHCCLQRALQANSKTWPAQSLSLNLVFLTQTWFQWQLFLWAETSLLQTPFNIFI